MSGSPDHPVKRLKQTELNSFFKKMSDCHKQVSERSSGIATMGASSIEGKKSEVAMETPSVELSAIPTSDDMQEIKNVKSSNDQTNSKHKCFGVPVCDMNREPACSPDLERLSASFNHTVLVNTDLPSTGCPRPFPELYIDKWHPDYVRLPCSPENLYPVFDADGTKKLTSRWNIITESLSSNMKTASDLKQCILKYNTRFESRWDFSALATFLEKVLSSEERKAFFDIILPRIAKLALDLPQLCTQGIPLLKSDQEHSITISQKQAASLLANAFFCTFPRRNTQHKHSEYFSYPNINFNQLFSSQEKKTGTESVKFEKLKCLLNYFRRVTSEDASGLISFQRKCIQTFPVWEDCSDLIMDVHLSSDGLIEEQDGMLQVDFANRFLGGGVLRRGCVQEEISFVLCPELIVSRLFCELMKKNEAVVITGCECYNKTSGYAKTFKWEGNFEDTLPRDKWNRLHRKIVAIDAVRFTSRHSPVQYNKDSVIRELNKAYVGFSESCLAPEDLSAVATGNWGCGAFNGNIHLKFLIQLMAASCSRRNIAYFTFGDPLLCESLYNMFNLLKSRNSTVGDVMKLLLNYHDVVVSTTKPGVKKVRLYTNLNSFIKSMCKTEDTDSDKTEVDSPVVTFNDCEGEPPLPSKNSDPKTSSNGSNAGNNSGFKSDMFEDSEDDSWLCEFYGVS